MSSNPQPTDREQLEDLHIRYGRAVDSYDAELMKKVFTDDAVRQYDGTDFEGQPIRGWEEFWRFFDSMLKKMDCAHHFTNFTFEIGGEEATYSCMLHAPHWPRGATFPGDVPLYIVGGRYTVRARRTAEGWRIADLRFRARWTSGDPSKIWPERY